ncbi:MAG: hypothetical protein NTY76_00385 [Candidatus Omnitrophica bacterium]|nr:hypothetical protein [Candidatus Omnitrophota bacterium]
MQKVRYELDPYNRLVLAGTGAKSDLPKFRQVLDGKFKTDENNSLSYHVKAPLSKDDNIPNQIKLSGEWSLTDDHELRLTLDKSARETFGDQVTLQGDILDVDKNSLLFAVTTAAKEGTRSTYILNIAGSWKADENNRISFHVKREGGRYDILTFDGMWEANKDHQIVYRYEKAKLARKKRQTHTVIFKGYWDIKDKVRLSYALSGDTDSVFDFKTSAGLFKKDYIQYEVGIGLTDRKKPATRTVKLSGKWNLKKDVGLVFEIEYEDKPAKAIIFGADIRLAGRDAISFRLKSGVGNKDMGIDLELSREIFNGEGEVFLKALVSGRESAICAGAAWRW